MSLQELCIDSAERYYQFLVQNNLGLLETAISDKRPLSDGLWRLAVARRIFDLDTIQLKVLGQTYHAHEDGHFVVDSYDEKTHILVIRLRQEIPGFEEASEDEIKIVSNLRFLVDRVRQWFVQNGQECRLPERGGKEDVPTWPLDLSSEQLIACKTALSAPCCYIWGPPGTGKTRYVLTSAVIARITQGCRVAVLTPTNLSLDLALSSILDACEELNASGHPVTHQDSALGPKHFLRLGIPSREFADRFPDVCEERGLQHQIAQLEHRAAALEMVIRYRKNNDILPSIDRILSLIDRAKGLLDRRGASILCQANLEQRARSLEAAVNSRLVKFTGWLTGSSRMTEQELAKCRDEIAACKQELSKIETEFTESIEQIQSERTGSSLLDDLYQQVATIRVFDQDASVRLEGFFTRLSEIRIKTAQFVASAQAHNESYAELAVEELESVRSDVLSEIEALRKRTIEERLRNARVIGCTVDAFIWRFRDSIVPVEHIFLDEACYTPVIKALTLFRRDIPVTLIGDHKQLPPVCEMDETEMQQQENNVCVLWSKSAMFAKFLLSNPLPSMESIFEHIAEPPPAGQLLRQTLTRTYRFGHNLAALLDELVYDQIGFASEVGDGAAVGIEVIPVPRTGGDRSNERECSAIRGWIQQHGAEGTVILAPYRRQVDMLCHTLPRELHDDVLTVHRSQGREWETVVLSATDTMMQNPFFTNTEIMVGKLVMNTALSRARERIILVCDASYWSHRLDAQRQLLSRLIQLGRQDDRE